MEINNNQQALSSQVDYKKMKSDWDVFNHQDEYEFLRPDLFCRQVVRYARHFNTLKEINQLQQQIKQQK